MTKKEILAQLAALQAAVAALGADDAALEAHDEVDDEATAALSDAVARLQSHDETDDQALSVLAGRVVALEQAVFGQPPPAPRFPGDPGAGSLYYGLNTQGGDPAAREATFGHRVGVYRSYWQPTQTDAMAAVCSRDLAAGRLPFVSTKLPGTWADVAAGVYDSWLQTIMARLGAVTGPVWLCLHHEPWDDQGTGQTPADYTAMYRHAYPMRPGNVALVPILQSAPFDPSVGGHADIAPWYDPAACDVVGIDTYNHWYPGGKTKWRDPSVVAAFFDQLAQFGKPIGLAEHGVRTDPANPGKAAAWMVEFRRLLLARGDVVAMSFFDSSSNVNDGGTPWTLDYGGDTERLNAFAGLLTATGSAYLNA